jgi:hypothetical protein
LQSVQYFAAWALCGNSCTADVDCGNPTSNDGCVTCTDNMCLPEAGSDFNWTKCGVECLTDKDCGTSTSSDGCFKCSVDKVCLP